MAPGANSIQVGGSGTFQAQPSPAGSAFPAGTTFTWSSDDPNITFSPSPDGDPTKIVATDAATDTAASFNLAAASSGGLTGKQAEALTPAPPPAATGITIVQLS